MGKEYLVGSLEKGRFSQSIKNGMSMYLSQCLKMMNVRYYGILRFKRIVLKEARRPDMIVVEKEK